MEKVRRFFRNFNEKRSYQIVFFAVSMCVILGIYIGIRTLILVDKSHEYTIINDNDLIKYIEDVKVEGKTLYISGWCFNKDVDSSRNQVQVFLQNLEDTKDVIWLETELMTREDIDEYYDCEYDYSRTGFEARTKAKKLDLLEKDYEIFIKLKYVKEFADESMSDGGFIEREYTKTVSTKRYICKGELTVFEQNEKKGPVRTASAELNEVFDKGILLMYREDADMYLYQYGKKLYWVAGENFFFEEDGTTYIQYQLYTSKPSQLPEERLMNEWYWDNIGFVFEENEYIVGGTPYRIAIRDIPTRYPILNFVTGYYSNKTWIWEEYITIDIDEFYK